MPSIFKIKRQRFFTSGKLLLLFMAISVTQYVMNGQVTWLTGSFRAIEITARELVRDPAKALKHTGQQITSLAGKMIEVDEPVKSPATIIADVTSKAEISWSAPAFDLSGLVVMVADGDTITVQDASKALHKIRLHGIDTPEYGQAYGLEARVALAKLLADKAVGVVVKDTDSHGRSVGVVYVGNTNVNVALVRSGHAWWYKQYAILDEDLRKAEEHARTLKRGLWSQATPIAPWDWRRGDR